MTALLSHTAEGVSKGRESYPVPAPTADEIRAAKNLGLGARHVPIIRLLASDLTQQEIADALCLSAAYVANLVSAVYAATSVRGREEFILRFHGIPVRSGHNAAFETLRTAFV